MAEYWLIIYIYICSIGCIIFSSRAYFLNEKKIEVMKKYRECFTKETFEVTKKLEEEKIAFINFQDLCENIQELQSLNESSVALNTSYQGFLLFFGSMMLSLAFFGVLYKPPVVPPVPTLLINRVLYHPSIFPGDSHRDIDPMYMNPESFSAQLQRRTPTGVVPPQGQTPITTENFDFSDCLGSELDVSRVLDVVDTVSQIVQNFPPT